MLIPKKTSKKKIMAYAGVIVAVVGYSGYLIFVTFIKPYYFNSGSGNNGGNNPVPVFNVPGNLDQAGPDKGDAAVKKNNAGDPIRILDNQKFKDLKDNMAIGSIQDETVGKKNPFEPYFRNTAASVPTSTLEDAAQADSEDRLETAEGETGR